MKIKKFNVGERKGLIVQNGSIATMEPPTIQNSFRPYWVALSGMGVFILAFLQIGFVFK